LAEYGLALPGPGRRKFAWLSALLLFFGCLPGFILATRDPQMRAVYPLCRTLESLGQLAVYEAGYLLFFVAIEFIFRGYLIFGLYRVKDAGPAGGIAGEEGPLVFGYYSILISMLSYTAWHLGKPPLETWGTLFWGLVAGTVVLISRSIWPIVAVHYLLNVFMDFRIWSTR
jgi:membrane protease YdiL (CAAX protease family)